MNKYQVGVWLEEVVLINIEAENEEQAREVAEELVDEEGGSTYELSHKHRHREFSVVDIEEINDGR